MDKRNRDRPFTDCRCHAFDAAAPNVTHGEHAWKRGFERMRYAVERPSGSGELFLRQVPSGLDETLRIERDTAIQPTGVRFGPRHVEYVLKIVTGYRAGAVAPPDTLKMFVSLKSHDLGSCLELDCWGLLYASNQVSRHARRKTAGADEQMNAFHRLRQKHRGLAGRVRSANDYDFIAFAELRFHEGRVVVDTRTFELSEIRERRPMVSSPSGNDHCASRDGHAVVESDAVGVVFADQLRGAFRDHDLGAKLLGLGVGASGQVSP